MSMSKAAIEARRAYQRQWRAKNKGRVREYHRKWRIDNKERLKEYQRRYWERKAVQGE